MRCPDRAQLERSVDGEPNAAVHAHLEHCPSCSASIASLREERRLMASLRHAQRAASASSLLDAPAGFKLLRQIGRGGQGEVFECLQLSTGRRVALKLCLHRNMATAAERARFTREVQIGARLSHPGLVTVYEAGATPQGAPYLALELVSGVRWDEWSDSLGDLGPAATERRLRVFARLCEAVAHAHQSGVLHRDLKPSNILVDAADQPHVLDLGLAKVLESDGSASRAEITATGQVLGSLGWMSPERLAGAAAEGFGDDVYSLGLLLARASSGRHAYPLGNSLTDILRGVATLPESLEGPYSTDRRLDQGVAGVLSRALAREPRERFADAGALGDEVERLIAGGAPLRRRASRRHRKLVLAAVAMLAPAIWFALGPGRSSSAKPSLAASFREVNELASSNALGARDEFWKLTCGASLDELGAFAPPPPNTAQVTRWQLVAAQLREALPLVSVMQFPVGYVAQGLPGESLSIVSDTDGQFVAFDSQSWEVRHRLRFPDLAGHNSGATFYATRPTFHVVHGYQPHDPRNPTLYRGFRLDADALVPTWSEERAGPVCLADFGGPALGSWEASTRRWRLRSLLTGETLRSFELSLQPICAAASPDGKRMYFATREGVVELDLATGQSRTLDAALTPPSEYVGAIANDTLVCGESSRPALSLPGRGRVQFFPPRSSMAACACGDDDSAVWLNSDELELLVRSRNPNQPAWRIATRWRPGTETRAARRAGRQSFELWSTSGLTRIDTSGAGFPAQHSFTLATLHDLDVTPDGEWIAPLAGEAIGAQDPDAPTAIARFRRSLNDESLVAHSPTLIRSTTVGPLTGRTFWCSDDGRVRELAADGSPSIVFEADPSAFLECLAIAPDESALGIGNAVGEVTILDLASGATRVFAYRAPRRAMRASDILWLADEPTVVVSTVEGHVSWCKPDGTRVQLDSGAGPTRCLAYDKAGRRVVSGHDGGKLVVWDSAHEIAERHQVRDGVSIWALDFSPDGELLALGSGQAVAVWDWPARTELFRSQAHEGRVFGVRFHPQRAVLGSAGELGEFFEWDFELAACLLAQERDQRPGHARTAIDSRVRARLDHLRQH